MNYWLMKTEPSTWSWADQLKAKQSNWDGVRNPQATAHMKAMKRGDLAFFYHTGDEKQVVGIARITREARPDPSDESGKAVMVEIKALQSLTQPVTLAQVKADTRLQHLALVKQSRLSVMPVDEAAWKIIVSMAS